MSCKEQTANVVCFEKRNAAIELESIFIDVSSCFLLLFYFEGMFTLQKHRIIQAGNDLKSDLWQKFASGSVQ